VNVDHLFSVDAPTVLRSRQTQFRSKNRAVMFETIFWL